MIGHHVKKSKKIYIKLNCQKNKVCSGQSFKKLRFNINKIRLNNKKKYNLTIIHIGK